MIRGHFLRTVSCLPPCYGTCDVGTLSPRYSGVLYTKDFISVFVVIPFSGDLW